MSTQPTPVHPVNPVAKPRCPRSVAMVLGGAVVVIAAQILIARGVAQFDAMLGQPAFALLASALGLLALLFERRMAAAGLGVIAACSALLAILSGQAGLVDGLVLAAAGGGAALAAWPAPGAARWAGLEFCSAFLLCAGAVCLASQTPLLSVVESPTPASGLRLVGLGALLLGLTLQGVIQDPAGDRSGRLYPLALATSVAALGLWLALALAYAQPQTNADALVLVLVLVAGPLAAWTRSRAMQHRSSAAESSMLRAASAAPAADAGASVPDGQPAVTLRTITEAEGKADTAGTAAGAAASTLAALSNDGVILIDADGKMTQFNLAMCTLFGFSEQPYLGHASAERVALRSADHRRSLSWAEHPLARALGGAEIRNEFVLVPNPGGARTAVVSASPLRAGGQADGAIQGAAMIARDVTDERAAARAHREQLERLQQSGEELRQVAFVAAHHLQEPLRGVTSYSQLLERRLGDQEEVSEFVQHLSREAKRVKSLTLDLLAYLETPAVAAHTEVVDLDAVVADAVRRVEDATGAELTILKDGLPSVHADRDGLVRVIEAILHNSVKFNDSGLPTVRIDADKADERCHLTFSDNGIGLPKDPDARDKLLGLFAQHHTIGTYPGNGVGLAIARKIVKANGGSLRFGETAGLNGSGATIELVLPAG